MIISLIEVARCRSRVILRRVTLYRNYSHKAHLDEGKIPRLNVKWYYATDVPISKPDWYNYKKEKDPQKFMPFSEYDSKRLERKFNHLHRDVDSGQTHNGNKIIVKGPPLGRSIVEVNEDKLFQVDVAKMTLSPVYWEGPLYEVRRGTWFNSDGIPLPNELSQSIEAGYHLKKPYLFPNKEMSRDLLLKEGQVVLENAGSAVTKISKEAITKFNQFKKDTPAEKAEEIDISEQKDIVDVGNDKLVLYADGKYAAIFPSEMDTEFQFGIIRNFTKSAVALISVEKIQRGFTEDLSKTIFDSLPENPIPGLADSIRNEVTQLFNPTAAVTGDTVVTGEEKSDVKPSESENEASARHKMKNMLESDYDSETSNDKADRKVDHLILCIHGIGQVLGSKYQSIDFTHSVNVLRNTMKTVYESDEKYKKLAHPGETGVDDLDYNSNNTIQVLPITWRHKIDFHPLKNFELYDDNGKYRLPNLSQINVDGIKSLRNILGDVVLDVLLYYEPHYIHQVFDVVVEELNRVCTLYKERNPHFNGKIHIMGHSLGSAIAFDLMSLQYNEIKDEPDLSKDLTFDVDSLFCVGSPVGVFKLLAQHNIASRSSLPAEFNPRSLSNTQSSPKCQNLYNIFHPCDPVGYRMEPLVSPRFSNFKPESVPFAVKGFNTQIKGLTTFGDSLQQKLAAVFSKKPAVKEDEEAGRVEDEDALSDIIRNLVTNDPKKKDRPSALVVKMRENDLNVLTELNRTGRIDYCLPTGVFDISLVSAISAHVSYFEDQNTAGFIMKEVLTSKEHCTETREISVYKKH